MSVDNCLHQFPDNFWQTNATGSPLGFGWECKDCPFQFLWNATSLEDVLDEVHHSEPVVGLCRGGGGGSCPFLASGCASWSNERHRNAAGEAVVAVDDASPSLLGNWGGGMLAVVVVILWVGRTVSVAIVQVMSAMKLQSSGQQQKRHRKRMTMASFGRRRRRFKVRCDNKGFW